MFSDTIRVIATDSVRIKATARILLGVTLGRPRGMWMGLALLPSLWMDLFVLSVGLMYACGVKR